jgi:hypothetical protein
MQRGSTDAARLRPGDRRRVPSQATPPATLDSLAYAESLYHYAGDRLDPFSLRCWIVRRLMLDDGLDHSSAALAFEHVLAAEPEQAGAQASTGASSPTPTSCTRPKPAASTRIARGRPRRSRSWRSRAATS